MFQKQKKHGIESETLTMDVTRVAWPLVQTDRVFLPKPGQWPQQQPVPQSVAAEHASTTFEFCGNNKQMNSIGKKKEQEVNLEIFIEARGGEEGIEQ